MKLWTTLDLSRLPNVLKNGLDNPYSEEIIFWNFPEIVAESAVSFEGELAFIEAEIPDGQIDEYFTRCMASWGDDTDAMANDLASMMEEGAPAGEIAALQQRVEKAEAAETGSEGFEVFGYACLDQILPPEMLKILDPAKMLEALESGDAGVVAEAIETSEATPFKSLNAAFWVWLIMLIENIFGPGAGQTEVATEAVETGPEEEEARTERVKEASLKRLKAKRKRKKKTAKKS